MFNKATPTFDSAMKMFTQAQDELKAAGEANNVELAEAQAKVEACQKEKTNIDRVSSFFANLLQG